MAKFRCDNIQCGYYNDVITIGSMKWVYSKSAGKLVPMKPVNCSLCGCGMVYIKNEFTVTAGLSFNINKFDAMAPDEKRAAMKKRSQQHFQKTDNGDLARLKQKVIDDNKRMILGGR